MKRFSDKNSMHTLNELNVTPLLDLAFVLLLIFMITTPLMENSNDLILPTGRQDGAVVDPNSVINISLFRDDRLLLNTEATAVISVTGFRASVASRCMWLTPRKIVASVRTQMCW